MRHPRSWIGLAKQNRGGVYRILPGTYRPGDVVKIERFVSLPARPPSPFCIGNPMKQDCIDAGYCTRRPACDE